MTILNEFTIYNWWHIVIMLSGVATVVMIMCTLSFCTEDGATAGLFFALAMFFLLLTFITYRAGRDVDGVLHSNCHRIEVSIDESTSFTEIMRQYKVVETRGDIYVLEERDNWEKSE